VKVTQPKPGVAVYDLGQNFAGWPRITASGPAGAEIKMTPGELLDSEGLVSQRSSGGPVSYNYTLRGGGEETWSPRFSYYGFRYVQVEGAAALRSLEGQFIHLDARRTGEFSCSNDRLNKIHALIDAAVRSNLQHSLTDCPHREKLGWLEQFHLMGPALLYDWDLRSYLPKIVRDMREAQTIDGLVPDIAPEYVVFGGGFRDSPEWGSTAFQLPWLAWQIYGDRETLAAGYRTMQPYRAYLNSKLQDGLLAYGLGDWYDIGPRASWATPRTRRTRIAWPRRSRKRIGKTEATPPAARPRSPCRSLSAWRPPPRGRVSSTNWWPTFARMAITPPRAISATATSCAHLWKVAAATWSMTWLSKILPPATRDRSPAAPPRSPRPGTPTPRVRRITSCSATSKSGSTPASPAYARKTRDCATSRSARSPSAI
jgi:hypothetical protein